MITQKGDLEQEDLEAFNAEYASEAVSDIVKILAQATLKAIREPTEEMVKAGVAFAQAVSLSGDYTWSEYISDLFQVMMDEAVKEEN